jgi:ABC-type phosphate transport system substrate-binding protein
MKRYVPAINRSGSLLALLTLSLCASAASPDVVVVVSAKNPLTTLSKSQIADVFLGKASRFPDGSPAMPIDQVEGAAARDEFYASFANKSVAQLKAYWSKIIFTGRGRPPREFLSSVEVKKFISANPDGIGYIERNALDASVKAVLPQ